MSRLRFPRREARLFRFRAQTCFCRGSHVAGQRERAIIYRRERETLETMASATQEEVVEQIKGMFPDMDADVILEVLGACGGRAEEAIQQLLVMSDPEAAEAEATANAVQQQDNELAHREHQHGERTSTPADQLQQDALFAQQLAQAEDEEMQRQYSEARQTERSRKPDVAVADKLADGWNGTHDASDPHAHTC